MERVGYFDAEGKCLAIYSGAGEHPADSRFVHSAVIPAGLDPNTVEWDAVRGGPKEKAKPEREHPVNEGKSLRQELEELKAEIAKLKAKNP